MARAARIKIIEQIEKARKSHVITYITSTRQGLEVQMAMDTVRFIYDHLEALPARNGNEPRKIDLFIHSNGGDGTVPWRLVTLIREYADHFSVLVPFRAFSAATLTALGADSIVMHPMGMLGPTDATVANQFNPLDSRNQQALGISVEDVTAYLALIKEDAGIQHEDQLVTAFNLLADKVHPLALGNVKRHMSQSRMMAKKLLSLHMNPDDNAHRVSTIVENLTSKSFFHGHPINRTEAREQVGLKTVENPTALVEKAMWRLYLEYEKEMQMSSPFDVASEFMAEHPALNPGDTARTSKKAAKMAFIESLSATDYYRMEYELVGQKLPTHATSVTLVTSNKGWTKERA
ncbi:MAG: hypothetical protein U1A72_17775 [Sulfuritalea sp.]|nr:hypothetical protein [Sulfuritalea sp.]